MSSGPVGSSVSIALPGESLPSLPRLKICRLFGVRYEHLERSKLSVCLSCLPVVVIPDMRID